MRISLNAGGLGGVAVAAFQADTASLIDKVDHLIIGFVAVKHQTRNLNGGAGQLQGALDSMQARINAETARRDAAIAAQEKAGGFLALAMRIDGQVAAAVQKNKEEFYQINPWLKPASDKPWYENAWNDICTLWDDTGDFLKKAWDGLMDFVTEHWKEILIGIAGIAIGAFLTFLTGGAFLPAFLAGLKMAAVGGLISGGISSSISMVGSAIQGDGFGTALGKAFAAFGDGFASGFMWGGIFAGASQALSAFKNTSAFSNLTKGPDGTGREFFRIGKTANSSYGRVTSYTTPKTSGITINFSNGAGNPIFRLEYDLVNSLHAHFTTAAHGMNYHRSLIPYLKYASNLFYIGLGIEAGADNLNEK